MSYRQAVALLICCSWIAVIGCGTGSTHSIPAPTQACSGIAITGSLRDSLNGNPVAQGWIFLESGTQAPLSALYNFSISAQTATNSSGKFTLCASAIPNPSLLVALAVDSSANAYPPYIAPVSGATNLNLPMGGCTLLCGLNGQAQTSATATISGVITSDPIAVSGKVIAQYAMLSPSNARIAWSVAIPSFGAPQPSAFTTAAGNCYGQEPFCASYSLKLPSQNPMVATSTGSVQQTGSPVYGISASVTPATCAPPASFAFFQQDSQSPLSAAPGAHITAAPMEFTACSN